ncbi:MAG TPA: hypothetical protein VEX60_13685 [Pyrinomonadaceae bacterium]|nr:hypothetical protein [Pyrinomonadaceae bacterium]
MSLPISFDDVQSYYCVGDLIITHRVIYFFPHTDSFEENKNRGVRPTDHLGFIGLFFDLLGAGSKELHTTTNHSRLLKSGLWKEGESSQMLQSRLDAHIAEQKKEKQRPEDFTLSLPKSMRFAVEDIQNLSVDYSGTLAFDAHYDNHFFGVGLKRKKLLREALREGGFLH